MNWFSNIFRKKLRPLDNVTQRAQKVLIFARKEADRFHHDYVGTEHLLGGLLAFNEGIAIELLKVMGMDLEVLKKNYEAEMKPGTLMIPPASLPFTPAGKKVLIHGAEEALKLGNAYIGTEHILLGLLRQGSGVAFRILRLSNIELESLRTELRKCQVVVESPSAPTRQK
jgi:ATP-dependent Clp protease ATP-binding subunit ClpC